MTTLDDLRQIASLYRNFPSVRIKQKDLRAILSLLDECKPLVRSCVKRSPVDPNFSEAQRLYAILNSDKPLENADD